MICNCKRCQCCGGRGSYAVDLGGRYAGRHKTCDTQNIEYCEECAGSGVEEECDECYDRRIESAERQYG